MVWVLLPVAAALLGLERAGYVRIARAPGSFRCWGARRGVVWLGEPVAVVRALFLAFKLLQGAVFLGWCALRGTPVPPPVHPVAWTVGGAALLAGQILSTLVFYRLGRVGIFCGDRLGYRVPWCRAFPFSVFAHPQYVGAALSVWGFFLVARFPEDDWILLPVVETVLYVAGAGLEAERSRPLRSAPARRPFPRDPTQYTGGTIAGSCEPDARKETAMREVLVLFLGATLLGATLIGLTEVAPAGAATSESAAQDVAYGTGSVLTTLVYAPIKASFCILGGITGGFTLPFAGPRTAERVVSRACGGTWAITPAALKGREPVRFLGAGAGPRTAARR